MAINLTFDLMGNPEPPSIVLANRNGNKLGQLKVNVKDIDVGDKFSTPSEFSFTLNKYIDGKPTPLWDKVVDFKLVYCSEWDMFFEIKVEVDEATETVKTVFCTQLGQAELSQIKVHNIHINEEGDTNWDTNNETYKSTILCDKEHTDISLLHRLIKDKAPHYSIDYVSPSIQRIQRSFSFDDISICDAFDEIGEEIGCLFVYHSNATKSGKPNRAISVYDLQQNCNGCGHRGEFTDICPKCRSTDITYGYGEDTTIFVTSDELATEGIQLVTDTDSVKNCFKLEGGDDLMTATIRNCNPNGSDYIWYFSDAIKEDMSDELVEKIESYDKEYQTYYSAHKYQLNEDIVNKYNNVVAKYGDYYKTKSSCLNCGHEDYFVNKCPICNSENILKGKQLQTINKSIIGYPNLMTAYYNTIDLLLYLESGLMPNVELSNTSAQEQVNLLESSVLSPVAVNVKNVADISEATAKSAVLSMAKIFVKPTYKVEIINSLLEPDVYPNNYIGEYKKWEGNFVITNYSDETDTATSNTFKIWINNATETFIKQKIEKSLNKENTDDYSITGLFAKDYNDFCNEIKKYALNPLNTFSAACDGCLSILHEQGVADDGNDESNAEEKAKKQALYNELYKPYYQKQQAINEEIARRESDIAIIKGVWDMSDENNPRCTTKGLQQYIEDCQKDIQDKLNFETYLGTNLWLELCSYRREDTYSNSNYISDGLNNAEIFEKANEFIGVAEEEIFKSAELQHSISATLNNLLSLPKFKPLLKSFKTGNWIRVQIDDKIYRLRLLEYDFSYGDSENISVEFSDVTKIKNGTTDVQDILSQASSMASSYDSVQRQAHKGDVARGTIDQWLIDGLNSADVQITNNDSEEILLTKNGLLARSYDDITDTYSPEQFKLTHNIMAYTTDNWETVSSALGKHKYQKWNGSAWVEDEDYGLSSKFVTAGNISGSQMVGGEIISSNYNPNKAGTRINLLNGDFDFAGGKIVYDSSENTVNLKNVTIEWTASEGDGGVNKPEVTVKDVSGLNEVLEQLEALDGRIQTYSQTDDPSTSWTDTQKEENIGDLWFNPDPDDGLTRRWNGSSWDVVTDSGLTDLVQSKAQIFTAQPTPPYYKGDLWVQGSTGDIMYCNTKLLNGDYNASHWTKASKYTDDSNLNTFINDTYTSTIAAINEQLDKKTETWYQSTDPSTAWETDDVKKVHCGDLWHCTTEIKDGSTVIRGNNSEWIWQEVVDGDNTTYQWAEMNVPDIVFDTIDGVASIYVTIPDTPVEGDLLIPAENILKADNTTVQYAANKVYRYDGNNWTPINYSDDTALNTFINESYTNTINGLNQSIKNSKSRSWYQEDDPSKSWATDENHTGDLWYDSSADSQKTYIYNGTKWQETNAPKAVFDKIDGKRQIFVSKPNSAYRTGDLWIISESDCDKDANDNYVITVNSVIYSSNATLVAKLPDGTSERNTYAESDWYSISTHEGMLALDNSTQALGLLSDIASDAKITPSEKQQIKLLMDNITSEYNSIIAQCQSYSIDAEDTQDSPNPYYSDYTNYINGYNALLECVNGVLTDMNTTTDVPTGYSTYFSNYYSAKEAIVSKIETATKGYSDSLFADFEGQLEDILDDLGQVDGRIQTFYQDEDPSNNWDTEEKEKSHEGDIWVDTDTGATYQWEKDATNKYDWVEIQNTYLTSLAQSKAQIFTSQPISYSKGDLIIPTVAFTVNDTTYSQYKVYTAIENSTAFDNSHWTGLNYTNDDTINTFILGDYKDTINTLQNSIDNKADTYYQSEKPHEEYNEIVDNDSYNLWVGDLWYDTDNGKTYIYQKTNAIDGENNVINDKYNYQWAYMSVPQEVFDKIDGVASIYVTIPSKPIRGDLLIPAEDIVVGSDETAITYKAGKVYRYNGTTWNEIKYTDDTKAEAAYALADNAKTIGDNLVSGLGFQRSTLTDEYIISPVIAGGHLLIGNTERTYAQIATDGTLTCTNANVSGAITATSLTLGNGVTIPTTSISGLDVYAKTEDIPVLPEDILYADDVSIDSSISVDGVTTQSITVGDKKYTSIVSGDFVLTNVGLGEDTEDGSKKYTCISKDGLLTAKNAIIYGTVYATAGEFTGSIKAGSTLYVGEHTDENGGTRYNTWIDKDGVLNTINANIDGEIRAASGSIGGFHIQPDMTDENGTVTQRCGWLYSGELQEGQDAVQIGDNKSIFLSATDMNGNANFFDENIDNWRLTVGNNFGVTSDGTAYMSDCEITGGSLRMGNIEDGYSAWMSVDEGVLNANGVNISGAINAVNGHIGRWTLDSQSLYATSQYSTGLCSIPNKVEDNNNEEDSEEEITFNSKGVVTAPIEGSLIVSSYQVVGYDTYLTPNVKIPIQTGGFKVTRIDDNSFRECEILENVQIPNNIQTIGSCAFSDCVNLKSVSMGKGVTSIDSMAFDGCSSLTKVYITDLTNWCNITFGQGNGDMREYDANPLSNKAKLYLNKTLVTNLAIPEAVTEIKDFAFYQCSSLVSVTIPDSVTSIGMSAFYGCENLTSITIGNNVTSISKYAFYNCPNLQRVIIPDSVTSIGEAAFRECPNLSIYCENPSMISNAKDNWSDVEPQLTTYNRPSLVSANGTSLPCIFAGADGHGIPYANDNANFMVLEDGSLYANAANIKGHIEADSGQIGALIINENNISSGDDGLTFLTTKDHRGLIVAQQLEVRDYFKANTFQVGKISGRSPNNSIYLDFESSGKTTQEIAVNVSDITITEGSTGLFGKYTSGEVRVTITTSHSLVNTKTFTVTAHYKRKDSEYSTTRTANIIIPSGQTTGLASFADLVVVNNNYGLDYYCYYTHATVTPNSYTEETANSTQAIASAASFVPNDSGQYLLGASDKKWKEIWCTQASINSSSDRNEKNSIELIPEEYGTFFDKLQPVRYKFNVNNSNRYHMGFISQDVKDALQNSNISTYDFAGYVEYDKDDGSKGYGLRYGEFIALCVNEIQKLKKRVAELENR